METIASEKLLLCLSRHVIFPSFRDLSLEVLNMAYPRFTQIEAKSVDPADKIFEVGTTISVFPSSWNCAEPMTRKRPFLCIRKRNLLHGGGI